MSYAFVTGGVIQSEGGLPLSARRLDNQQWIMGLATASTADQRATGYYLVVDTARPADTPTNTTDRTLTLPGGVPTVTWVSRAKTAAELAADTQSTNQTDLLTKATTALNTNATFLAIGAPTNAQAVAQTQALTRQVTALIKLVEARLFGDAAKLNDTSGT